MPRYYEERQPTATGFIRGYYRGFKGCVLIVSLVANFFFIRVTDFHVAQDEPLPPASKQQQQAKADVEAGRDYLSQIDKGGR